MPGKSQTPALRFAGFTGEWEERKLCDCVRIRTGFPFASKDFSEDGEYLVITNGNIKDEFDDVDGTIGNRISISDEGLCREYELNDSDILVTMDGNVGRSAKVVSSKQILAQRVGRLTASENRDFFYQTLNTGAFCSAMALLAHGGTIKHISLSEIGAYRFLSPRYSLEQAAIGRFFCKVDSLITQQQKKVEKLQGLKKGLMKKMFPRGGQALPEVRFAGFDGEWEKRKVKEVCSISTGKSNTQDRACDGKYPFYVRSAVIERSHKYLYDEEAVLTVGDGVSTGKVFHYVNGKYDLHQRAYRMYAFSKVDARYFYYVFSKDFGKRVSSMTAKTSVDSVRMEMIADMEFAMPEKSEQSSIGRLFRKLDDLITLHGQKLEKLRHVKQALLGKMFV